VRHSVPRDRRAAAGEAGAADRHALD